MKNKKISMIKCVFKMSIYLFNIFSKSKGNDHITPTLTPSDAIPGFF